MKLQDKNYIIYLTQFREPLSSEPESLAYSSEFERPETSQCNRASTLSPTRRMGTYGPAVPASSEYMQESWAWHYAAKYIGQQEAGPLRLPAPIRHLRSATTRRLHYFTT